MKKIAGIKFENSKIIYYEVGFLKVIKNNYVIARYNGCLDFGKIMSLFETNKNVKLPRIVRVASSYDKKKYLENKKTEKSVKNICMQKINKYKLKMKLIDAHLTFDKMRIVFYFMAETRIDFRNLVRELSHDLKIKIEMKQIGVRDEARSMPTIGICGRPLCCNKFLKQFKTVSIKMAKDQGLSLSPMKISGNCGRLLCCLSYEQETYDKLNKNIPAVDSIIITPDGKGKVLSVNILTQKIKVIFFGDSPAETITRVYPVSKIKILNQK